MHCNNFISAFSSGINTKDSLGDKDGLFVKEAKKATLKIEEQLQIECRLSVMRGTNPFRNKEAIDFVLLILTLAI